MITDKKEFYGGAAMMAGFLAVLFIMFLPLFEGQKNSLNYLDDLFNSISKNSAYYIPTIKTNVAKSETGKNLTLDLSLDSDTLAKEGALLLQKSGASVAVDGKSIHAVGDLGLMLGNCLDDADTLFNNNGQALQDKYGIEGKKTLFVWHSILKSLQKALDKQEKFDESKVVYTVMTKAVECAYNYYRVVPQKMSERLGMVVFSLVFYVIYTMWYGYAILYLFEGWGLQISH
ncbi:MAG: hypothetical protein ACOZF0_14260 [Thermodesulfobacteriota bacterium]